MIEVSSLEFVVEYHLLLTKELEQFKKGLNGSLIQEILMWIEMLMVEWGILLSPTKIEP